MLNSLYKTLLDIIFPQKELELEISTLLPENLSGKLHIKETGESISLFQYKDTLIRQMVWLLKYKKNLHVAQLFASVLCDYLMEELSDEIIFSGNLRVVIVPLPLSKRRERERGSNQIKLVTDELQKLGEFDVDAGLLIKKVHTVPQTSLPNKKARAKNIKGAFEVRSNRDLKNVHVILIDDVLTTGSTLYEAQKTLKAAGVHKVSCITFTH
jgi:competence protein ComFC